VSDSGTYEATWLCMDMSARSITPHYILFLTTLPVNPIPKGQNVADGILNKAQCTVVSTHFELRHQS
jgi:hypothetical protein